MTDVGLEVVRSVYQTMKVDRQWSVWHQRGFTWWGHRLAQHIWADPCVEDQGLVISRVHARTDLLVGFTGSDDQFVSLMLLTPVSTSLSGPIRDPGDPSRVQLAANVYVHAGTKDWLAYVLATAAVIQAEWAHREVEHLAKAVKIKPACSAHPLSGRRKEWDDILNVPSQLLVPMGQGVSRYQGREMLDTLDMLQAPPCVLASGDEKGFCAEFPFGHWTSLLQVKTELPHMVLGNGLHMVLQLPEDPSGLESPEAARMALELNEREQQARPFAHFLGSWCPAPTLCFVSFFPNGLFANGWGRTLAQKARARAHWAAVDVFQAGWDFEEALKLKMEMSPEEHAALAKAGRAAVGLVPEEMMDKPVTTGMSADEIKALERAVDRIGATIAAEERQGVKPTEKTAPPEASPPRASPLEPLSPIRFPCAHCGKTLKATAEKAGHRSRCPCCRKSVTVPRPPTATLVPESAAKAPSIFAEWLQRVKAETANDCRRACVPHLGADPLLSLGEILPVACWGIFNAMGPTAHTLALGRESPGQPYLLFDAVSNPFMGFCTTIRGWHPAQLQPALLQETLLNVAKNQGQEGQDHAPLSCPPTFIVSQPPSALPPEAIKPFFLELLRACGAAGLADNCRTLREHWCKPWDRTWAESHMDELLDVARKLPPEATIEQRLEHYRSLLGQAIAKHAVDDGHFEEWWELVTNEDHLATELMEMPVAWEEAIEYAKGLPAVEGAEGGLAFHWQFWFRDKDGQERLRWILRRRIWMEGEPITEMRRTAEIAVHQGCMVRDKAKTQEALAILADQYYLFYGPLNEYKEVHNALDRIRQAVERDDWEGVMGRLLAHLASLRRSEALLKEAPPERLGRYEE